MYFETEYFGGAGSQGAAVFRDGEIAYGPKAAEFGPINEALEILGVRPPSTSASMNASQLLLALLVAVFLGVFGWDRYNHRKAQRMSSSWNCFRCGVELGPMQSVDIRVAGGPGPATSARACKRCARRDARIWWGDMGLICVLLVVTVVLLALS